ADLVAFLLDLDTVAVVPAEPDGGRRGALLLLLLDEPRAALGCLGGHRRLGAGRVRVDHHVLVRSMYERRAAAERGERPGRKRRLAGHRNPFPRVGPPPRGLPCWARSVGTLRP